jgi:hypothetical protein
MSREIDTDYLVVGAGAAGMAFTDEILTHSDATVTLVDRRHAPGGHWVDAYPYVRLHQPSAFYGVSSTRLGNDTIDVTGINQGFYELASGDEIRAYYERLVARRFLPSGRVRYFPNCDYVGDHRFVSRLGPQSWQVRVNKKLVDATYLEGTVPATSPPPFEVESGVRVAHAGEIASVSDRPERYALVGGGKTALDACVWLLEHGVPSAAITWIKPREAWWMNRKFQQPFQLSLDYFRGIALQARAMAEGRTADEILLRLEADGVFLRVDPDVAATMLRGAIISDGELRLVRQIEKVVRMGRVRRIGRTEIVLEGGSIPTDERTLHVHCAASALALPPTRPIFEPGRIHVQPIGWGYICFQFATIAVVEATVDGDDEKNRLCRPIQYWNENVDYLKAFLATLVGGQARNQHPALRAWTDSTRLNPTNAASAFFDHPDAIEARSTFKRLGPQVVANLARVVASM